MGTQLVLKYILLLVYMKFVSIIVILMIRKNKVVFYLHKYLNCNAVTSEGPKAIV